MPILLCLKEIQVSKETVWVWDADFPGSGRSMGKCIVREVGRALLRQTFRCEQEVVEQNVRQDWHQTWSSPFLLSWSCWRPPGWPAGSCLCAAWQHSQPRRGAFSFRSSALPLAFRACEKGGHLVLYAIISGHNRTFIFKNQILFLEGEVIS